MQSTADPGLVWKVAFRERRSRGDSRIGPFGPELELRLRGCVFPLKSERDAEKEGLERIDAGLSDRVFGAVVELIAAVPVLIIIALEDMLAPVVGVTPGGIDQDLVDPVHEGKLCKGELARQLARGPRAVLEVGEKGEKLGLDLMLVGRTERPNPKLLFRGETEVH